MKAVIKVNATLGSFNLQDSEVEIGSTDYMNEQLFDLFTAEFPEIEENEDNELSQDDISFEVSDWCDLAEHESLQDEDLFEDIEDYNGYNDLEVLNAGVYCGVSIDNIDEAYSGHFRDDEDFAMEMAESLGYINKNAQWPYTCIDWEQAAKELMYDYSEENGHYFRSL